MILWLGLILFIGMHLYPSVPGARACLAGRIGEKPYKGLFSLLSLLGLVLIVIGFGQRPYMPVGDGVAPVWASHLAFTVMPIVFILFAAANMKGRIRKYTRHPMMIATLLWAVAHLIANPDVRAHILFGAFALFAVLSIASAEWRGKRVRIEAPLLKHDLIAVGGGLVVFGGVLALHGMLFGVQPTLG